MIHRVLLVDIIIDPEIGWIFHGTSLQEVTGSNIFVLIWILNIWSLIYNILCVNFFLGPWSRFLRDAAWSDLNLFSDSANSLLKPWFVVCLRIDNFYVMFSKFIFKWFSWSGWIYCSRSLRWSSRSIASGWASSTWVRKIWEFCIWHVELGRHYYFATFFLQFVELLKILMTSWANLWIAPDICIVFIISEPVVLTKSASHLFLNLGLVVKKWPTFTSYLRLICMWSRCHINGHLHAEFGRSAHYLFWSFEI